MYLMIAAKRMLSAISVAGIVPGIFLLALALTSADAFEFKPYKDRAFKYRTPLEIRDNGDFLRLPYDVLRDINKRDELPVRKVHSRYVSFLPRRHEQDLVMSANGRKITYFAVGKLAGGASMTVIFLHGRDGSRHLGFDDDRFGGNFNRIKNLLYRNNGIYISSDFADFENSGLQDIKALIANYRPLTSGPLVVACGSMGTFLCWKLLRDKQASAMVDGYVILGGFPQPAFLKSGKLKIPQRKVPIFFAHGSIDSVYPWQNTHKFYEAIRKASPGYPIRYALFDTGKHGTPVRMIDWRVTLNWIAAQ